MPHLQHGGTQIHFAEAGQGPAVLLLHAFPFSSEMWAPQLAGLRSEFHLLAPDLPGFGRSPEDGPMTMERYAVQALAVLDACGISKAAVVGLSMGGYVALELWARAADRVAALVLCDTRATPDSEDGKKAREATARAVEEDGVEVLVERLAPNLVSHEAGPELRKEVERITLTTSEEGAAAALRAMARRRDFTGQLGSIACPTLVLVGNHDSLIPVEEAQALAHAIPNARCEVIAGAGHLSNLEQPAAFNAALAGFLREVVPG